MMPLLTTELAQAVEACFDADDCEVGTNCANPAIWWAHNPCGCRLRSCAACKQLIVKLRDLAALHADLLPQLGCGVCLTPVDVEAIVWEPIKT
jgi:hypothetical protein